MGTETATDCSGYMDGAIQSGERTAKEILLKMNVTLKDPDKEVRKMKASKIFLCIPYPCLSFLNKMRCYFHPLLHFGSDYSICSIDIAIVHLLILAV